MDGQRVGPARRDRGIAGTALIAVVLVAAVAAAGGCSAAGAGEESPAPAASSGAGGPATPADQGGSAGGAASPAAAPSTTVVFIDVGQGDATAVRSGSWSGLIDGGPRGSASRVASTLAGLGIRRLGMVVVSHDHADHTGGLPGIVARFRPRRALVAGRVTGALAAAFRRAGTVVVRARRGLTARFGAARASVLSPSRLSGDANADSIVLRLVVGGRRLLFTGDCEGPAEAAVGRVCARGPPVDVLKVSHHGSAYSTTGAFLAAVRPRYAVISVGRNSYGHPAPATLARLRGAGARAYCTRKNGSVTLAITAGGSLKWRFGRSPVPLIR